MVVKGDIGVDVHVFVASDLAALPWLVEWVAKLCGAAVLIPGVLRGDRAGPIVTYEPSLTKVARQIFVSARFREQSPSEASVLDALVPPSRCTFLEGPAEFQQAKAQAQAKKQNATVLGLFTDEELAVCHGLPAYLRRHMFNAKGFARFLHRVALADSNLGADQV